MDRVDMLDKIISVSTAKSSGFPKIHRNCESHFKDKFSWYVKVFKLGNFPQRKTHQNPSSKLNSKLNLMSSMTSSDVFPSPDH